MSEALSWWRVEVHNARVRLWNARARQASLVGLLALLAAAALALSGCSPRMPAPPAAPALRSPAEQARGAVLLSVVCVTGDPFGEGEDEFRSFGYRLGNGTGVALDDRRVLTAQHVVDCRHAREIRGVAGNGARARFRVVEEDAAADLALIEVSGAEGLGLGLAPPVVAAAAPGDAACAAAAYPERISECGAVERVDASSDADVVGGWRTRPGNSGAGLWVGGRLAGVVVQLTWCGPPGGATCGGKATAVAGRHARWFAP